MTDEEILAVLDSVESLLRSLEPHVGERTLKSALQSVLILQQRRAIGAYKALKEKNKTKTQKLRGDIEVATNLTGDLTVT